MVMYPFKNNDRQKGIGLSIALVGIVFFAVSLNNSTELLNIGSFSLTTQGLGVITFILGLIYFVESITS